MTLGEWLEDELKGMAVQAPWNPLVSADYRTGYLAALREVEERLTARSRRCPLPKSE